MTCAALVCIILYAGLLPLGRWQDDEYTLVTDLRHWGWVMLWPRLHYSPRPFSEGVLELYGEAVLAAGRPLVPTFLAVLWAGTLIAGWLAAFASLPAARGRFLWALGLSTSLLAFFLVGEPLTELFYWPMSAAAYLPTLAAAVVLTFLLPRPPPPFAAGAALLVAATSSEIGAAFAVFFAGGSGLAWLFGRRVALRRCAWWILPGVAGAAVFVMLGRMRVGMAELGSQTAPYTGRLGASLAAATLQLGRELMAGGTFGVLDGGGLTQGWNWSGAALAMRLAMGVAFGGIWRIAGGRWRGLDGRRAVLAASLLLTAWFSLVAAYYHYGTLCCERQEALRGCLIDLAFVLLVGMPLVAAAATARTRAAQSLLRRGAAPLLAAVLLVGLSGHAADLRDSYRALHYAVDGRSRTWTSGLAPTASMAFYMPPDGPDVLVRGTSVPQLAYGPGSPAPLLIEAMKRFFGKSKVTVCQPWQSEHSWVVKGVLVPACGPDIPMAAAR